MVDCDACGKPIKWIETKHGKAMPVDPKPQKVVTNLGEIVTGYIPHWATCSEPDRFRKSS